MTLKPTPDDYRCAEGADAEDPPRRFSVPDVPTDDKREQRIEAGPSGLKMVAMAMLAVVIVAVLVGVWSGEW